MIKARIYVGPHIFEIPLDGQAGTDLEKGMEAVKTDLKNGVHLMPDDSSMVEIQKYDALLVTDDGQEDLTAKAVKAAEDFAATKDHNFEYDCTYLGTRVVIAGVMRVEAGIVALMPIRVNGHSLGQVFSKPEAVLRLVYDEATRQQIKDPVIALPDTSEISFQEARGQLADHVADLLDKRKTGRAFIPWALEKTEGGK